MLRAVIIHGTNSSPDANWIPWLASELNARRVEAIVPRFPTPDGQSLSAWEQVFRDHGLLPGPGSPDEEQIFIGHSLGVAFLLRMLERGASNVRVTAGVCGFVEKIGLPLYDKLNESFVSGPFDWPIIRKNAGSFLCYAGDDDPYVPLERVQELAANLETPLRIIKGGGHINLESGFREFPRLLEDLELCGAFGGCEGSA